MFTNARVKEEASFRFHDSDLKLDCIPLKDKCLAIRTLPPGSRLHSQENTWWPGQDGKGACYMPPEDRLRLVPGSRPPPPPTSPALHTEAAPCNNKGVCLEPNFKTKETILSFLSHHAD